jgi:hypothetical protein
MDDSFHEIIVKARHSGRDTLKMAGLTAAGLILIILTLYFSPYLGGLVLLILIGILYGLYYLLRSFSREYEYTITNGDLDIDLIIARSRRRRIFSGAARTFASMEPLAGGSRLPAAQGQLLDCRARQERGTDYLIRAEYKGKPVTVLFSPDETIVTQLRRYNPGRIRLG